MMPFFLDEKGRKNQDCVLLNGKTTYLKIPAILGSRKYNICIENTFPFRDLDCLA